MVAIDAGARLREGCGVVEVAVAAVHVLRRDDAVAFARACVDSAGLAARVEITADDRDGVLLVSGPDQFGLMGTTAYISLRIVLPATTLAVGLAIARHVLSEFHATDDEILARIAELPLPLAVVLSARRAT